MGEVYPGIELKLKAHGYTVEKLFHVRPGAAPEQIRMKLNGAPMRINHRGDLEILTALGPVTFSAPGAYQDIDGVRHPVKVRYAVLDSTYGFTLGRYSKDHSLVIDPIPAATFVGGSGSEFGFSVALDASDHAYVGLPELNVKTCKC